MSVAQVQGGLSKLKKKHFRVKHQKVKLFRANEPILSVFMWGVNHTVSLPTSLPTRPRLGPKLILFHCLGGCDVHLVILLGVAI